MAGTIIVDGVAASVYIDFLGGEAAAHRSAAKYRLAARFAPRLVRWLHDRGLNQPLLLFMAEALPEVRCCHPTVLQRQVRSLTMDCNATTTLACDAASLLSPPDKCFPAQHPSMCTLLPLVDPGLL